jgi:hypothetical protein
MKTNHIPKSFEGQKIWSDKVGLWSDNGQKRLDYDQKMVRKGWIMVR